MSTTIKSGKLQVKTHAYKAAFEEAQVNLLTSGLLEFKTADSLGLIKLGPSSKAEISDANPQNTFTVSCSNKKKETTFQVINSQELEPWVNMINLVRARQSAKIIHEHPLSDHDFPIHMDSACVGCSKNLISSVCEFCEPGQFQLCSDCNSSIKHVRSPFVKSKTHQHELMRFEKAMDPKFFPRAYNNGRFICSICNGTSNGPVYHCVECGEYDECSKCIGTLAASPFAVLGGLIGASLQGKDANEMTLNLNLVSAAFQKDPRPNAYKLMKDPKRFPGAASAVANRHWDLSQIEKQPVNGAYFEVTFDQFNNDEVIGIGIGNQIFVPNKYLGAQQNSFGYFNSGVIAKNGVYDHGNDVPKINPGDTVGAGILYDSFNQRRVYFTKNGKKLDYIPSLITDFVHDGMDCFPGVSFARDSQVVFTTNMTGPFKFNPSTIPNYRGDKLDRISKLPSEILTDILAYAAVSPLQVAEMRRVSKRFSETGNHNTVWRKMFLERWPDQNAKLQLKSWMNMYKRRATTPKNPSDIHIENCNLEFTCPLLWENLKDTKNDKERFCDKCKKTVYEVSDLDTLKQYSQLGRCVSLRYAPPPPPADMWHMQLGGPPPPMDWQPADAPPMPPGPPPPRPPPPM